MKILIYVLSLLVLFFLFTGCGKQDNRNEQNEPRGNVEDSTSYQNYIEAVAEIKPLKDQNIQGTVTFTQVADGKIKVVADITGLTPGKHGFHIHENGDCSAPDGKSAGAHFNPGIHKHGAPTDTERHEGDLGNLDADQSGKAHLEWVDEMISFEGDNSILGKAILVHAKVDDLKSQPAGDSGDRIGCGIITKKQ